VRIPSSTIEVPDIDRDPVGRSASGMKLAEALHCFHSVRLLTCWSLPQVYKLAFQSLQFKRTTNATENVHSKVYLASSRQKIKIISCQACGLLIPDRRRSSLKLISDTNSQTFSISPVQFLHKRRQSINQSKFIF